MAIEEQNRDLEGDVNFRIIATVDRSKLPRLREALQAMRPLSVIVSHASSWSEAGQEGVYRGQRYRLDRQVARVEIVCGERQVAWIMNAVDGVVAAGDGVLRDQDTVVAFPIAAGG